MDRDQRIAELKSQIEKLEYERQIAQGKVMASMDLGTTSQEFDARSDEESLSREIEILKKELADLGRQERNPNS